MANEPSHRETLQPRPVIPGSPGAPGVLEAQHLGMISFFVLFDKPQPDGTNARATTVEEATDQEFDTWIRSIYERYLFSEEERCDHGWPVERRLSLCNRLWKKGEIWGVKYVSVGAQTETPHEMTAE